MRATSKSPVDIKLSDLADQIRACAIDCRCSYCTHGCPVLEVSGELEFGFARTRATAALNILEGKMEYSKHLLEQLAYCTTCRYCVENCFFLRERKTGVRVIDIPRITEVMRKECVKAVGPLLGHEQIKKSILELKNALNEPHEKRFTWLAETDVNPPEKASVVYYAGCMASYRRQDEAVATVKLLSKAKVNFTVLREEVCCGSILLRTGLTDVVPSLVEHNVKAVKASGADTLVTSCAGCYVTWKVNYPEFLGEKLPFKVAHSSEYLYRLVRERRISLGSYDGVVTYSDPCHLGRHGGVFEAPRQLLRGVKGLKLVEMKFSGRDSKCCGAGGGFRRFDKYLSVEIARRRIQEAKDVGASALIVACPLCAFNFSEVGGIDVYDLPVFLLKTMENKTSM